MYLMESAVMLGQESIKPVDETPGAAIDGTTVEVPWRSATA